MSTTPTPFDPAAYIKAENEREAALRSGKPVEPAAPVKVADPAETAKPGEGDAAKPAAPLPKHVRREINRLRSEKAQLEGRLQAYAEMGIKPGEKQAAAPAAGDEDAEPTRDKFGSDAEYAIAMGRWDARQEARKVLATRDEATSAAARLEDVKKAIDTADTKLAADRALLPDWDEVAKKAADIEVDWTKHPNLYMRLAQSDVKAFVLYHFAKHPEALQSLLEVGADEIRQDRMFSRLEGQVEKLYTTTEKPKEEKAKPTAAELDAKKHKPSESVGPKGGSAPTVSTPMLLEDGKTLNPAWKAEQNEREGLRR